MSSCRKHPASDDCVACKLEKENFALVQRISNMDIIYNQTISRHKTADFVLEKMVEQNKTLIARLKEFEGG